MRAVIVGAGIGGLAAAVALERVGIEATVVERSESIREVGAGLSLWANAVKALHQLGVAEEVVNLGSVVDRVRNLSRTGSAATEMALPAAGAVSICVHRGRLQRCLLGRIPPQRVRTGMRCTGFSESAALLEGGGRCEADFLIGADGIDSVIRAQIHGAVPPRYAGYTCWRGITPDPGVLAAGSSLTAAGRGSQVGIFPCGAGHLYWFFTRNGQLGKSWGRDDLLRLSRAWPAPIPQIIESTAEPLRNDVIDRPPLEHWGVGKVTLLGDAAHSTTPNLGQGACQALEDAVVLADCMRRTDSVEVGLRTYERIRMPRSNFVVRQSWRLGRLLQNENPVVEFFRDWVATTSLGRGMTDRLFRRLLSYDPPALG